MTASEAHTSPPRPPRSLLLAESVSLCLARSIPLFSAVFFFPPFRSGFAHTRAPRKENIKRIRMICAGRSGAGRALWILPRLVLPAAPRPARLAQLVIRIENASVIFQSAIPGLGGRAVAEAQSGRGGRPLAVTKRACHFILGNGNREAANAGRGMASRGEAWVETSRWSEQGGRARAAPGRHGPGTRPHHGHRPPGAGLWIIGKPSAKIRRQNHGAKNDPRIEKFSSTGLVCRARVGSATRRPNAGRRCAGRVPRCRCQHRRRPRGRAG